MNNANENDSLISFKLALADLMKIQDKLSQMNKPAEILKLREEKELKRKEIIQMFMDKC